MSKSLWWCASFVGVFMWGCLPASTGGGDGGGIGIDGEGGFVASMLALQTATECRHIAECPERAYDSFPLAGRHASLEECLSAHQILRFDFEPLRLGFDPERVAFDEDAARDCVEAYEAQLDASVCSAAVFEILDARALPDVCAGVYTGLVEREGACVNDFECVGASVCVVQDGECEGVCLAPGSSACGGDVCAPGQRCLDGACAEVGGLGAPCGSRNDCTEDATCNEGTCTAHYSVSAGAECSTSSACAFGTVCNREAGPGMGVCAPPPAYAIVGDGEACTFDYVTDAYAQHCEAGLACVSIVSMFPVADEGVCGAPTESGLPCAYTRECAPGLYCTEFASSLGRCAPTKAAGGECQFGFECGSGACIAGVCTGDASCR